MTHKRLWFWLAVAVLFFVFLYMIRSILLPFVLGIFTAYFLDPATDRLEKAGLKRWMATLILTVCFFVTIILLTVLIAPVIAGQLSGLIIDLPVYVAELEQQLEPKLSQLLGGLPAQHMERLTSAVSDVSGIAVKLAGDFIAGLFQSGMAFVNLLSLVLITPVVAFYMLRDWDGLTARIDRLLPRAYAPVIRAQLAVIDDTLAGFLRGQINVCLILAAYYALGLSLAGLKFGIVIGIVTGLLVIFPYVGFLLGMAVGMAVAFFQFDSTAPILVVLAVFLIGTAVEGAYITPKLVGDKVGLHPVWIIFGMLSGAALFGFVGVLLAVPVTAVIGVLLRFALAQYMESSYYHAASPSPPKK